jgi:hypothetical protein
MATLLEQYKSGDHVAVWEELVALGDEISHKRVYADAVGVATETMRRVRHNVELLIRRLDEMGYCFVTMEVRDHCEAQAQKKFLQANTRRALKLHPGDAITPLSSEDLRSGVRATAIKSARKASQGKSPLKNHDVLEPPTRRTALQLGRLENMAGGPLPLSLRAWYEQVGAVSLLGYPETLQPELHMDPGTGDPLMIASPDVLLRLMKEEGDEEDSPLWQGGKMRLPLAPDRVFKASGGGADPYGMLIPNPCADGIFDDGNDKTFVNYLRNALAWGGFPGWKSRKKQTREIVAKLTEGLLPL